MGADHDSGGRQQRDVGFRTPDSSFSRAASFRRITSITSRYSGKVTMSAASSLEIEMLVPYLGLSGSRIQWPISE